MITARDVDQPKGKRLDFEISGKLKGTQVVATQKGTKVVVEKIFHNLPVRKKELEKNIKREYGKVLTLLQAYACISTGVRFVVSNTMPKGAKSVAFSTGINATTKDNITNVFGAKTLHALVKLELKLEMQPTQPGSATQAARIQSTQLDPSSRQVTVEGHISRPVFGEGRQAPDRQMFFVNSRPCALPQVAKAFNEVYKTFNVSQSPFIFANLIMDTNAYDVNVSPDKRTILLHDQVLLLESLKTSLAGLFESQEQSIPQSKLSSTKLPAYKLLTVSRRSDPEISTEAIEPTSPRQPNRTADSPDLTSSKRQSATPSTAKTPTNDDELDSDRDSKPYRFATQRGAPDRLIHDWVGRSAQDRDELPTARSKPQQPPQAPVQSAFDRMRPPRTPHQTAEITIGNVTTSTVIGNASSAFKKRRIHTPKTPQVKGLRAFAMSGTQVGTDDDSAEESGEDEEASESDDAAVQKPSPVQSNEEQGDAESSEEEADDNLEPESPEEKLVHSFSSEDHVVARREYPQIQQPFIEEDSDETDVEASLSSSMLLSDGKPASAYPSNQFLADADSDDEYLDEDDKKIREDEKVARLIQEAEEAAARPSADDIKRASRIMSGRAGSKQATLSLIKTLDLSLEQLQYEAHMLSHDVGVSSGDGKPIGDDGDAATIADNIDKVDAEAQLSLTVSKSDFANMAIIGQFNLGFVLALRPGADPSSSDLFIIDQHAADEKYNFERFTRTLSLEPQRLAQPKQLDLTAIEEEIILAHPDALLANGFEIESDTSGDTSVGQRCTLLSLPMSKEKTFDLSDLEELLHLLSEHSGSDILRPSKVRKMLAMRACRSSIMVGKTLTATQMQKVVRNLGEMDKPWNCPHGRPTMRHLAGLGNWVGWNGVPDWENSEGERRGGLTDWSGWMKTRKAKAETEEKDVEEEEEEV